MISLPVLLVLEEERMKRRKSENKNHNLLMTQTIPKSKPRQWKNTSFPYKKRKFQKRWPNKQRNKGRPKNACYHCERFGHIRKNCPNYNNNNNKNNGTKQIIMTISEAMIIKPLSDNWWIDTAAT